MILKNIIITVKYGYIPPVGLCHLFFLINIRHVMLICAYILKRQASFYKEFDSGESSAKFPSNGAHVSPLSREKGPPLPAQRVWGN